MSGISTKEIHHRIRSMESTRQITKAMEMVAASKLRKAQMQLTASRPYFETLYSTMQEILRHNREASSPYLQERSGNKALYVVIAGDRGLAGGYNSNIVKLVQRDIQDKDAMILPIGRKAEDSFKSTPLFCKSPTAAEMGIGDSFSLSRELCTAFISSAFDEIQLAYTHFESALSQVPRIMPMLPLKIQRAATGDILYEGGSESVFASVVPEYLGGLLYGALWESRASESAARRNAMDSATRNANDRIADLRLTFNRARQAAITQEITEIVAGSERS